ncbi:MAG: Cold-shock box protein [Bacteroidota bacterium]|jgi:ATP-dependent RNA helicase DeaD
MNFSDMQLNDALLKGIEALGFETPTPVQSLVIPTALQDSGDIIALAQTGTGKTAAFGLPLLQLSDPTMRLPQAVVLCPTRELCVQVASDLVNYTKFAHQYKVTAVYGGASIETQIRSIKAGTQIVVATPGRLIDLLERRAIDFSKIKRVILDEADEMLNRGFKEDLDTILAAASESRESVWLFSATMSAEVRAIASSYMRNAQELTIGRKNQTNENIEHVYYVCRNDDRYLTLKRIVDANPGIYGLIFCRTKMDAKEIAEQMNRDGYNSDALHGDLSQNERDRVMNRFREGTLQLLIATDVAARGIDVSNISHVINYGLPDDIEVYTHRSGRTGRAGKKGTSITILTTKFEPRIRDIERLTKAAFEKKMIPQAEEVCEAQLMQIIQTMHDVKVMDDDIAPFLPKINEKLEDLSKEELIKRFASLEFNRFLDYYKDARDLNGYQRRTTRTDSPTRDGGGFDRPTSGARGSGMVRLFLNVGEMDGVDKKTFLKTFSEDFGVPGGSIGRIDIKKSFLHFDIEQGQVENLKKRFQGATLSGRKLRLDEVDKPQGFGGGFNGGGGGSRYGGNKNGGGSGYGSEKKFDKGSYRNEKPFGNRTDKKYEKTPAGDFERDYVKDFDQSWDGGGSDDAGDRQKRKRK